MGYHSCIDWSVSIVDLTCIHRYVQMIYGLGIDTGIEEDNLLSYTYIYDFLDLVHLYGDIVGFEHAEIRNGLCA